MKNDESSGEASIVQARAMQIRDESSLFIEACKMSIQTARKLSDEARSLCDEAMILKEECIAVKSKALANLKLSNQFNELVGKGSANQSGAKEDTSVLLQMIEEVRKAPISAQDPLHTLRAQLLGLSFLPDS